MRQVDSVFFAASSTSDNSSKEEDQAHPKDASVEEDEYDGCWFPDESVMDILGEEFWKKCMRKKLSK